VSPVSSWTLRALDQVGRYLCLSVGQVLGGKKLCAGQKEFIAHMFFKWAFFKVKKARPAHVGKSNYFAKRGKAGKVKKGIVFKAPSLKK
jgi:hypothetical protein